MNDYHRKPSLAVSNEAQKQCSTPDRNLSYVFDDHRLEQSREPKKTEKSTYFTKYNYDWNGPKVSSNIDSPIKTDSTGPYRFVVRPVSFEGHPLLCQKNVQFGSLRRPTFGFQYRPL